MERISGKIPRGFTRFYVLDLLTEKKMTGKEIIDEAISQTEGDWAPSPGLIYPLLGRLVRDGHILELDEGKFTITEQGREELKKYEKMRQQIDKQYQLVNKLTFSMYSTGKMLAEDAVDRINVFSSAIRRRVQERSESVQTSFDDKYEEFLEKELERIRKTKENPRDESPQTDTPPQF